MGTNIDNIIVVNEQEIIQTSIDGYFKNLAIVGRFENSSLLNSYSFSPMGVEEFESLSAIGEIFPTTHQVYKCAKDVFAQKVNTGMNKSAVEKVAICQVLNTDSNIEEALVRIGYSDAYHWVLISNNDDDIDSFVEYFADKRKIPHVQTNEKEVLSNEKVVKQVGEEQVEVDNIAKLLRDKNAKAVIYYHALTDEFLNGAMGSIHCFNRPGKIAGVFDKPSGITQDDLTYNQKSNLDKNCVNYYTAYIGQAGKYQTRVLTAGGFMSNGDEIQQQVILDRIILNLQSAGMDALEMKIPYDDRGGSILEGKLKASLRQLQNEELIAEDSLADDGTLKKGQTLQVLLRETAKQQYPSKFAEKCFVVKATVELALNAKKVEINLVYQA